MKNKKVKEQELMSGENEILRVSLDDKNFDLPFRIIGSNKVAFLDLSGQVALVEKAADLLAQQLLEEGVDFDVILNPVAKSSALAHAVAVRLMKAGKAVLTERLCPEKQNRANITPSKQAIVL